MRSGDHDTVELWGVNTAWAYKACKAVHDALVEAVKVRQ